MNCNGSRPDCASSSTRLRTAAGSCSITASVVRKWLLEGLEEGIPGRTREHVRLVEDVDLPPAESGSEVDLLAQVADVLDRVVRCGVHLDHVQRRRVGDRTARLALAAGHQGR